MKIYEYDQAMLDLIDKETGEIFDFESYEKLKIDKDIKIDNLITYYKSIVALSEAIKRQEEILRERRYSKDKKAESIRKYLSNILEGKKFETPRNVVGWRKSESVNISNELLIDELYKTRKVDVSINKSMIRDAIKLGIKVSGAELISKNNIQIK